MPAARLAQWDSAEDGPRAIRTAHSCWKRQLVVITDGKQQPEGRRMHTPAGDIMAQSHLFQNRNLGSFLFLFFCLFSKTSSIPRALPS